MKSADKITADLMKRIRTMTPPEYNQWLLDGIVLVKKMPKASDLYFLEKIRNERKLDAIMKLIHSDGLEEWRKKHNKS